MQDNPYSKFIEEMEKRGSNKSSPSIQIGRVVSPNPLTIQIGDLPVDESNILIADHLAKDYHRKASINNINATGSTNTADGHSHKLSSLDIGQAKIGFSDALKSNDRLAVLATADRQTYIILAKLVSP